MKKNTDVIFMILTDASLFKGMKKWKNVHIVEISIAKVPNGSNSVPYITRLR